MTFSFMSAVFSSEGIIARATIADEGSAVARACASGSEVLERPGLRALRASQRTGWVAVRPRLRAGARRRGPRGPGAPAPQDRLGRTEREMGEGRLRLPLARLRDAGRAPSGRRSARMRPARALAPPSRTGSAACRVGR